MSGEILVAIDLEDEAHHAALISKAWQIAQIDNESLAVVTVVPDYGMSSVGIFFPPGTAQQAMERASAMLHQIVARILPEDAPRQVSHLVRRGTAYHEILEAAKERKPTLIVMGAHHPMLSDYLLGSTAARVLHHADCSVYILRVSGSNSEP